MASCAKVASRPMPSTSSTCSLLAIENPTASVGIPASTQAMSEK
jgi:hypothetical protein